MLLVVMGWLGCSATPTPTPTGTGPTGTPTAETGTPTPPTPTADTGEWWLDCVKKLTKKPAGPVHAVGYELGKQHESVVFTHWCQQTAGPVTVEYSFENDEWHQAPTVDGVVGANRRVVVGIPYGYTAQWRLRLGDDTVVDANDPIVIPDPPKGMPLPSVALPTPRRDWAETDRYLLTSVSEDGASWGSSGPYHVAIFDREGRPVWTDYGPRGVRTLYAQVSVTGRTLLYDRFRGPSGDANAVAVRSYLDGEVERIPIARHHHAFVELPDGTIAWGAHGVTGEQLMERAPGATVDTEVWNCATDWPEARSCISNSLFYDAASGQYFYSFYTVETVVAIERATGEIQWWAGKAAPAKGVTDPRYYVFDPPTSQFWWQHGVFVTPSGTLMVSTHDSDVGQVTNYGREFTINHDKRALELKFEYDGGVLADFNGDIRRIGGGHTLHSFGTGSVVKEVDENGRDVWALDFNADGVTKRHVGKSEFIRDLYELTSTWEEPSAKAKTSQ